MGVTRDITERKQAEETILSLSKFPSENPDPILRIDRDGKLLYINNSGLNKLSEWHLQKGQIVSSMLKDIITEALNSGLVKSINLEHGKQTYLFSVKPVSDAGYTNLYGIDITERKNVEEQLQKTLESLKNAVGVTIHALVSAIESRDPYTAGHQIRVANLARAIATEMELPPDKIEGIRMAGSIHDIGKLSIPSEILSKPTKLTNLEFLMIKEHSQSGYDMLKDVESPWPLAQIVYQHHERMNGTGYPRNLKGDEILLEARIMAVADVVEAMASHRPYRPGLGIEAALEEIEKNKGILYDNTVADACLKLFREKGCQFT
jgi:HD-GYP domain-containing protein (c-di-GMP phosphodiesterase class II)